MKKIIIFLGPPGSGKGTQAELLSEKFNYKHISTGELLRKLLENKNQYTKEEVAEAEKVERGEMVADWLIFKLVFAAITDYINQGKGVVLDGAIRRGSQAHEFLKFFSEKNFLPELAVIWLRLTEEESWRRLSYRRVCSVCGLNIPYTTETQDWATCPKCGGVLKKRFDDKNEEVFKRRIADQGESSLALIAEEFKKFDPKLVKEIEGMDSIEKVFTEVTRALKK
ncbi:MAG: nucleoside monophosphate kinase [Candidatus Magasanikbacteria bacterium]|nr:nucleoside monophosphate kinase [Candidatus Magasanikbacteria bacterium]